jgi:DNA recombination protein RmuC
MRPDVIIHYPDGKDVIIDSKVSLTAYVDYMNSADETARKSALDRHLVSVRNHIKELKQKNYAAYNNKSGRDTVEFVLMFIPNEGPFHLAMLSDPSLWNEAFKEKVLIVSPTNLMSLLKIIHIAWTREEQSRNQQEILKTAAELLDRLYSFYEDFDNIGTQLLKVQKAYDEATNRLKQGTKNRSVVLSGEKLKKLGVRMTKQHKMPESLKTIEELTAPESE